MIKLNEDSNRIQRAIFGDYKGKISTFAILTAQNPMGINISAEENNKRNKLFEEQLKNLGIREYDKIVGSYGNKEDSYILYNLTYDDAKTLSAMFMQQSFFYGKTSDLSKYTSVNKDTPKSIVTYYECNIDRNTDGIMDVYNRIDADKNKSYITKHGGYKEIESHVGAELVGDAIDFYSRKGALKFKISLQYFESYESEQPEVVDLYALNESLNDSYTIHKRAKMRALAYNGNRLS